MKELKINISLFFITMLLLLNTNIMYLFENISTDFVLVFLGTFIIHSFIITYKNKLKFSSQFKYNVLAILGLVFTSSIAAKNSYNQSIWLGIRPQRLQILWYLAYFAIYRLVATDKLKFESIEKIIYKIGITELIIFGIFWLSKGKLENIIHMPFDYRYGLVRLRGDVLVVVFLFIIALNNYLNNKEQKKNAILLVCIYIFEVFCVQTRIVVIAFSIALFVVFLLWKKSIGVKICFIPIIIIAIFAFANTSMGKDLINQVLYNTASSLDIREDGKKFYIEELKKSPILGRGFVNSQWKNAVIASGQNKGYFANDNGVIAFAWIYGILGIFWMLWTGFKVIKITWNAYSIEKNYIGILWLILIISMSSNIIWWWWRQTGIFEIIISIVFAEKITNKKEILE